jgi:hypothetical protein
MRATAARLPAGSLVEIELTNRRLRALNRPAVLQWLTGVGHGRDGVPQSQLAIDFFHHLGPRPYAAVGAAPAP